MKITEAHRIQSHLLQEMGKKGLFGSSGRKLSLEAFLKCLSTIPPATCTLNVGDKVICTNINGVDFETTVLGFDRSPRHPDAVIFLCTDSYWYAVEESSLRLA